ncbi:threonylcarbamoyladenosine dehydratase [Seminavis robusta]|uniref:Threonylcarbamoyladenosine dehydratase n=1 Tax=Seminavis robusta TaxID=568900 RepID=A0A9N8DVE5_9STRA|nr:threonylcarbamoyladenosine dehydratase [Seminavis robusta]|eukprot:Sro390_g132870.1 threonylcarbamoyladenosine dehydratase (485) ;mRNA; r:41096-42651
MASLSSSRNTAALTGFALGTAAALAGVWMVSHLRKKTPKKSETKSYTGKAVDLPGEIRDEQLSRHTLYFGEEGMDRLKNSSILVVGVGGVGSHVAHMLGRAGVGHLRLIDFDQVTVSSLNRHACATLADVGIPKVTCMKDFLEKICPDPKHLRVEAMAEMYTQENGERLLQLPHDTTKQQWDLVIDAIDDVPTKAALLAHCLQNNIRVYSCMGAGGKSDVTRLHISDLRTAAKDPLASKLRQSMKRILKTQQTSTSGVDGSDYLENMEKLAIIYSSEKPVVKLADFTPEQKAQGVHTFGAVDGMRIRVLPVLGTMPAVMGQTLAAMALCELGGKPMSPVTGERLGKNVRNRMYQHLKRREERITKDVVSSSNNNSNSLDAANLPPQGVLVDGTWIGPLKIDQDDMSYLMEVWRNRCAVTGDRLGNVLELVRWDKSKPTLCNNLVLMGVAALKKFDDIGKDSIPQEVQQVIEKRLASCNIDGYYG